MRDIRTTPGEFAPVSARWLLTTIALVLLGAIGCAWAALCLLYWQGSWQLLYHPTASITRTPRDLGLAYETVHFPGGASQPLTGWYLPTIQGDFDGRLTVLYLHGAAGNVSDTLDTLAALHRHHLAIFAIDYRGYGPNPSSPTGPFHPSESSLRQDAEWALTWLTVNRNTPPGSILICGSGLGANLAARLAADHSELAGLILDQALQDPMAVVFNDPRSRLVPSRLLVKDRYDLTAAASSLKLPSLWLFPQLPAANSNPVPEAAFEATSFAKTAAWLNPPTFLDAHLDQTLNRWLDDLPGSRPR